MPFTIPTKPTWLYSSTDAMFRHDSPGEPHGLPLSPTDAMFRADSPDIPNGLPMSYPLIPLPIIKPDPESPIRRPTVSPITPEIKKEEEEEEEVEKEKKPCRLTLHLPKQDIPVVKEEEKPAGLMLPPPVPSKPSSSKTKTGTRASVHKEDKNFLKLKLAPPKTPINKSRKFRGEGARNWVRHDDFEEHVTLGVTPLMGKSVNNVLDGEFLGLSGVDVGDVKGHLGMGLYDGSGEAMSAGIIALRARLWGKKSWAARRMKG